MKIFKHLLATAVVAVMLASCAGGNAVRDDKRAAKVVAEIRNPKSKNVLVMHIRHHDPLILPYTTLLFHNCFHHLFLSVT